MSKKKTTEATEATEATTEPTEATEATATGATGAEATNGAAATAAAATIAAMEEGATEPPPPAPEEDKEVLAATLLMAQAADGGSDKALAMADKMQRGLLLRVIAFQLPGTWITPETRTRLDKIETDALALMLSWLALNWWAGYENGRKDTVDALRQVAAKGLEKPENVTALEAEIKADQAARTGGE